jgi:hypothetical protein
MVAGPGAAADKASAMRTCRLSIRERELSVDDYVIHPYRQLMWVGVSRTVGNCGRIEHDRVGIITLLQRAAILQ